MNHVKLISLMNLFSVLLFVSKSFAWNIGIEADFLHPLLRSTERTQFDRTWISPRLFFAENFHIGAELIHDDGEISGFASGTSIGERSAPTNYQGLGFGYYVSGYHNNSVRFSLTTGPAKRKFVDSLLGTLETTGIFYLTEAGYQFVSHFGLLGLSIGWIDSDLLEETTFSSGGNQSEMKKTNSDIFLKLAVGASF